MSVEPEPNAIQLAVKPEKDGFTNDKISIFGTRTRFIMVLIVLLCLASTWSNILTFNFAVICMETPENFSSMDEMDMPSRHDFTSNQQIWLTAIVAVAALLANFPVVSLVNHFGIRTIFTGLGLISATSTCFIPIALYHGYYYFLILRFLQGIAFASNFPVIGSFCSRWAYIKQNGWFMSCLVGYVQLSPAITMPLSGALCQASGWPMVFYLHGLISMLIFITYGLFYRNNPAKHPMVSTVEFRKISVGKSSMNKKQLKKIPYWEILKTPAVWAVWCAALGNFICVNMHLMFSPLYIKKVLGFEIHQTGITAALGPLTQFITKVGVGIISDKIRFLTEGTKLRLFNTIAFFGSATALIALAFTDTANNRMCMLLLGTSAGVLGAATGGFFKSAPLISKQYSHFVTGNISLGLTITMLFLPFAMHFIAPNNSSSEWSMIFLATASILIIANIIFCILGDAEACEWTTEEFMMRTTRSAPQLTISKHRQVPPPIKNYQNPATDYVY